MKRAEAKNRLYRRRCMNCGFLGAVPLSDSSRALADLGVVKPMSRQQWAHALRIAREMGKFHGSEYDPRMVQNLGLDEATPFGVMCGLGRPEGPLQPTFFLVQRRSVYEPTPEPPLPPGFQVREATPPGDPRLGRVIAVIQTFVWPLVRPHACPAFMKTREGLTPAEHAAAREGARRWKRDAVVVFIGIVLGALLNRLLGG